MIVETSLCADGCSIPELNPDEREMLLEFGAAVRGLNARTRNSQAAYEFIAEVLEKAASEVTHQN